MTRYWTCHWRFETWQPDVNTEYETVDCSGGSTFSKRGIAVGDTVYVISLSAGQLYLGGRMTVKQITSRDEAVRLLGSDNLYDAPEWVVDPERAGTPLHLHRRLSPQLTKRLRFESKTGPKEPCFVSDTELDNQATRGVRELTAASAALLDRIIDCTDQLPRSAEMLTVTDEFLQEGTPPTIPSSAELHEGAARETTHNVYERNPEARRLCLEHHGRACAVCGMSFGLLYGPLAEGFIHIHHLRPLAEIRTEHRVDHVANMRPVCPNCHAVLHLGGECRSIEDVRRLIEGRKLKNH